MRNFLISFISFVVLIGSALAEDVNTFKVGVILPLTGALAEYGMAAKNGIELAVKENPEIFSRVKFVYEDSQYDNYKAISSYQKLKNIDGVSVAYVWGYGPNQALVPIVERDKFPLIAVSAERSVSLDKKYTLRSCYHIEMIADSLLEYLRVNKIKHIGIVKTELAYMNGLISSMKKKFKSDESIEIVDTYQPGDTDFKPTLAKLRSKKFDALGVFLIGGQISQFYKKSKQLGMNLNTFGTDFFDSMKEVQDSEGAMIGSVFAGPYVDQSFLGRYVKDYGNEFQVAWAANSYEYALLTVKLFGDTKDKLTGDQILDRYKSSTEEQGSATRFRYNESAEGSGFDFKVVGRKIQPDRIVDIVP